MTPRLDIDDEQKSDLIAALIELHRRKQRHARAKNGDNAYERVLHHFEQRDKRLRTELLVTEELVERSLGSARALPPPSVQQELEISGPLGGTAAGRFRVHNRSDSAAVVEFVVGDAFAGPAPSLRFEPAYPEVPAGGTTLVKVVADLTAMNEPGSSTVPIECRSSGRRDRLWLIVTAFSRNAGNP